MPSPSPQDRKRAGSTLAVGGTRDRKQSVTLSPDSSQRDLDVSLDRPSISEGSERHGSIFDYAQG